jgi:hypothetical protein
LTYPVIKSWHTKGAPLPLILKTASPIH